MATIKAKDLQRVCQVVSDLRAAVGALAGSETPRIAQAFDSATRDLAAILKPLNPKFDAKRFARDCGVKGAE